MAAAPATTLTAPATTPITPLKPINSLLSPAAPLVRAAEVAAVEVLPPEAVIEPDMDLEAMDDIEAMDAMDDMDMDMADVMLAEAPDAEAPRTELALASKLDKGGREMDEVALPRSTETDPEVTTWLPHRADWSWSEVCCSALVQLLHVSACI
jgi:hypothetical protein